MDLPSEDAVLHQGRRLGAAAGSVGGWNCRHQGPPVTAVPRQFMSVSVFQCVFFMGNPTRAEPRVVLDILGDRGRFTEQHIGGEFLSYPSLIGQPKKGYPFRHP